jgi:hypothetical protein
VLFASLLMAFGNGCATPPQTQPLFVEASFQQSPPSGLRLLPVVDGRKDTSVNVDLEGNVRHFLKSSIKDRGYEVELVNWPASGSLPPTSDPSAMKQSELIPYLPPGSTPVVLIILEGTQKTDNLLSKNFDCRDFGTGFRSGHGKAPLDAPLYWALPMDWQSSRFGSRYCNG